MLRVLTRKKLKLEYTYFQRNVHHISNSEVSPLLRPHYLQPILVGTTSCAGIFIVAAIVHEREKESFWKKLKNRTDIPSWSKLREIITDENLFNLDIWEARKRLLIEKKEEWMQTLNDNLERYQGLPDSVKSVLTTILKSILSMTEAERTISVLIAINVLVFGAWRVPRMQPFMNRYFVHNPVARGHSITLLTSCFSQRQFTHLALNMVALWTVGPWIYDTLGREQFVAMYLSLGVGSNTISHVAQLALRRHRPIIPSQGASGAIYGLLTGTAVIYPEAALFVAFLPSVPLKISYAIPALVSLDIAGTLLRWRMFNHLGHLGGAVLGASYMHFGPNYLWPGILQEVRNVKAHFRGGKENGGGDDTSGVLMEIPKKIRLKLLGKKAAVPEEQ